MTDPYKLTDNFKRKPITKIIGNMGLVAVALKELRVREIIDSIIPKLGPNVKVSHGQAVEAFILNSLNCDSRPLYLMRTALMSLDLDRMIGCSAEDFNDDILGRTLDALWECEDGVSGVFEAIAVPAAKKSGYEGQLCKLHVDSTSFHYDGKGSDEPEAVKITYGYSRDCHPELKQVMLQMITASFGTSGVGFPLAIRPLDGNSNDQKTFADGIEDANRLKDCLMGAPGCEYLVADCAMYTESNLKKAREKGVHLVTRAPNKLAEVRKRIKENLGSLKEFGDGHEGKIIEVEHYGSKQKWLIVKTRQAAARTKSAMDRGIKASLKKAQDAVNGAMKSGPFSCLPDAEKAAAALAAKKFDYHTVEVSAEEEPYYTKRGPHSEKNKAVRWVLKAEIKENAEAIREESDFIGTFVIATTDAGRDWTEQELLDGYKSQQAVERGFRYLKDPMFFTSALFLEKPSRVEALLMIMTLALLVYSYLEHKIRNTLKEKGMLWPNQAGRMVKNPTLRMMFDYYRNAMSVYYGGRSEVSLVLFEQGITLLGILGKEYEKMYDV